MPHRLLFFSSRRNRNRGFQLVLLYCSIHYYYIRNILWMLIVCESECVYICWNGSTELSEIWNGNSPSNKFIRISGFFYSVVWQQPAKLWQSLSGSLKSLTLLRRAIRPIQNLLYDHRMMCKERPTIEVNFIVQSSVRAAISILHPFFQVKCDAEIETALHNILKRGSRSDARHRMFTYPLRNRRDPRHFRLREGAWWIRDIAIF